MAGSTGRTVETESGASPRSVGAFEWLARAQQEPLYACREWDDHGWALLPLGARFNTVCLEAHIVHTAVGSNDLDTVKATLVELLDGPVIHNPAQKLYYPLVNVSPVARWPYREGAPMLGFGHFLSVPAPGRTGPTGHHWAVPPRIVGNVCAVSAVAALVALGLRPSVREVR
ncbi:hypothetical protein [Streptomyces sp. PA5.6]|uniref:hypothetical protein n=1 Tax=Streptomyces sp. PA5.6 TaxID=3035651 RepID=UPI003904DACA